MCHLLWTFLEEIETSWYLFPESNDISFGHKVNEDFLSSNKIELIVRSHHVVLQGFKLMHNEKLLSIFSASNYREKCSNFGAVLQIDENLQRSYLIYNIWLHLNLFNTFNSWNNSLIYILLRNYVSSYS